MGIIRAGYQVFLISPTTSPLALAHLISTSAVSHILVNSNVLSDKMSRSIHDAHATVEIVRTLDWDSMFSGEQGTVSRPQVYDPGSTTIVLHSSGETVTLSGGTVSRIPTPQDQPRSQNCIHGLRK